MMLLRRTVAATVLPVTLGDALDQLRTDGTSDGAYIQALIASACDLIGEMTGRVLGIETWVASCASVSGDFNLPKSPVLAVSSITYFDANDVQQPAIVGDFYLFASDDRSVLRPKSGKSWPSTITREDAVSITFTAGYEVLPPALRAAILLMVGHLYENREAVVADGKPEALPMGVEQLVGTYRLGWVAA
jgi:uncharacterized phiE125 gp8 family phage protein